MNIARLLTLLVLMAFVTAPAMAEGYKACYTGNWFETPGEGIALDVVDAERVVGQFYGYAVDGRNRWFTIDAGPSGRGTLYTTDAGMNLQNIGAFSLDFIDRDTLLFVFDISINIDGQNYWCLNTSQCKGERVMTRLTQPVDCE